MGTVGTLPRGKPDHSPPTVDEVMTVWSYTSTPPTHPHGTVLD